jgi:hypothetical protein
MVHVRGFAPHIEGGDEYTPWNHSARRRATHGAGSRESLALYDVIIWRRCCAQSIAKKAPIGLILFLISTALIIGATTEKLHN